MISPEENFYYSRQLIIDEIGLEGQEKLKQAKVIVIGAGGLGCPALQYLVAIGVGHIAIVDSDNIEISNLHRQVLFSVNTIGENKAQTAQNILSKLNPFIKIESLPVRLRADNAISLLNNFDIVVDCTDNFATRFLVNDACVLLNKPLVSGSIYKFEGQVTVFNFLGGPTLRCMYPQVHENEFEMNCSLSGVIGVLPGIIGMLQANEVIKIILGMGKVLSGAVLLFNAKFNSFEKFALKRNPQINYDLIFDKGELNEKNYAMSICSIDNESIENTNSFEFLETYDLNNYSILDVRNTEEKPQFEAHGVIQIPLNTLQENLHLIPKSPNILVVCSSGLRSRKAIKILQESFKEQHFQNLEDGISLQFIEIWKKKKSL